MPLRRDISQNYALKAAIEELLGNQAWLDLKENTSIATWRRYAVKIMDAIEISIHESVEVRDEAWAKEVKANLERGRSSARTTKNIEDLISVLSATLLRQVFLQIGLCPNRQRVRSVSLNRKNWRLNGHRSVQYVQSPAQVESCFWSVQQKRIGVEKQMELHNEYRGSKSKVPFSQWCRERGA